jgi:hypothetical protein
VHGMRGCMVCVSAWYAWVHGMRECMVCVSAWYAWVHGIVLSLEQGAP